MSIYRVPTPPRGGGTGVRRRRAKVPRAALAGLMGVLLVAGCGFGTSPEIPHDAQSGGQTQADLDATLRTIPGLTFTEAAGSEPNVKGRTGYGFSVEVDPAYTLVDAPALVDFLVRSAWSVRDGYMPNTSVEIRYLGVPGDDLDLTVATEEAGWVPSGSQTRRGMAGNGATGTTVWLDDTAQKGEQRGADVNRDRLGDWPGSVPDLPSDLVALREPG